MRRRYWQLIRGGLAPVDAVRALGVSESLGQRWFREAGGVIPSLVQEPTGYRLSFAEREEIALLNSAGHGVNEIARRVGRDKATISRELRRPSIGRWGGYRASVAQAEAAELERLAHAHQRPEEDTRRG